MELLDLVSVNQCQKWFFVLFGQTVLAAVERVLNEHERVFTISPRETREREGKEREFCRSPDAHTTTRRIYVRTAKRSVRVAQRVSSNRFLSTARENTFCTCASARAPTFSGYYKSQHGTLRITKGVGPSSNMRRCTCRTIVLFLTFILLSGKC